MTAIELKPVDRIQLTILIDNVTDPLLVDQDDVTRINWPKALLGSIPRSRSQTSPERGVPDALIAEPGFSALVRIRKEEREHTLLFDTGVSPRGMVENMRRLGISPGDVEVIVLSHGHWDHVTGMEGLVRALGRKALPVMIHPEFWSRRRIRFPGLEPAELPATSRPALEGMGFEIVEERQPSFLLDGSALVTGEVDRTSGFETGFQGHEARRGSRWKADPLILDDQALVVRLRDRGLVILNGCGHAGIVNTVHYAQKLTAEPKIAAIIGGFHLSGPMFEPITAPTVEALGFRLAQGLQERLRSPLAPTTALLQSNRGASTRRSVTLSVAVDDHQSSRRRARDRCIPAAVRELAQLEVRVEMQQCCFQRQSIGGGRAIQCLPTFAQMTGSKRDADASRAAAARGSNSPGCAPVRGAIEIAGVRRLDTGRVVRHERTRRLAAGAENRPTSSRRVWTRFWREYQGRRHTLDTRFGVSTRLRPYRTAILLPPARGSAGRPETRAPAVRQSEARRPPGRVPARLS